MAQIVDYARPADYRQAKIALKLAVDALCRINNVADLDQAKQIAVETIEKLSPGRIMKTCPPAPIDLDEDAP